MSGNLVTRLFYWSSSVGELQNVLDELIFTMEERPLESLFINGLYPVSESAIPLALLPMV